MTTQVINFEHEITVAFNEASVDVAGDTTRASELIKQTSLEIALSTHEMSDDPVVAIDVAKLVAKNLAYQIGANDFWGDYSGACTEAVVKLERKYPGTKIAETLNRLGQKDRFPT